MSISHTERVAAAHEAAGVSMQTVRCVWEEYVQWRRQGVTFDVAFDRDVVLDTLVYCAPPHVDVTQLRTWMRQNKTPLILLLVAHEVDNPEDVPGTGLLAGFMNHEYAHAAVLGMLIALVAEDYATPPLGRLDWDAAREAWATGHSWSDDDAPVPPLTVLDATTAADRVVRHAANVQDDDTAAVHGACAEYDAGLNHALLRAVAAAQPWGRPDMAAWLDAAYWAVKSEITPWLIAHANDVLAEIERMATRWDPEKASP